MTVNEQLTPKTSLHNSTKSEEEGDSSDIFYKERPEWSWLTTRKGDEEFDFE